MVLDIFYNECSTSIDYGDKLRKALRITLTSLCYELKANWYEFPTIYQLAIAQIQEELETIKLYLTDLGV